jgi:beta-mannanase
LRVALTAVCILVGGVTASSATAALSPKLVPLHGALLGVMAPDVPQFEELIGHDVKIEHSFYTWTTEFPSDHELWTVANGRIPMITWEPTDTRLAGIANGRWDEVIRARAEAARAFGLPFFLRFAHEMNGNWYPWSGYYNGRDPRRYVAAWRHVHDLFSEAGATNVIWVWSPHWKSFPTRRWNNFRRYYPGDAYVDWVGIDGYNHGPARWWKWQSFDSLIRDVYGTYAVRKPIMVSETSSVERGGSKAKWIAGMTGAIKRYIRIRAVVWFHLRARYSGVTFDWRVDTSPTALLAFQRLAADPYFDPSD